MGRFVGEIGQKTAKTTTIFKSISPTLDFLRKKYIGMAGTADTWSIIKNSAATWFFYFWHSALLGSRHPRISNKINWREKSELNNSEMNLTVR